MHHDISSCCTFNQDETNDLITHGGIKVGVRLDKSDWNIGHDGKIGGSRFGNEPQILKIDSIRGIRRGGGGAGIRGTNTRLAPEIFGAVRVV